MKELESSILSADPFINPNWDQKSGGNFSSENEWSNLDFNSATIAAISDSYLHRYLDINKNNSTFLNISHSCLFFSWSSDGVPTRKCHGVTSEDILHFYGTPQEGIWM